MLKSNFDRSRSAAAGAAASEATRPAAAGADSAFHTTGLSTWSSLDTRAREPGAAAAAQRALATRAEPSGWPWLVATSAALLLMLAAALRAWVDGLQFILPALPSAVWGGLSTAAGVLAVLCVLALLRQQRRTAQAQHAALAHSQALAQAHQLDTQRVNDATQAAIVRLMNELQRVAEGDLTQQATVSEDITGSIADSVNYTVEELRSLVLQVQATSARVIATTEQTEYDANRLLVDASAQLHALRQTGQSVLEAVARSQQLAEQAQGAASVARQSRLAAESGLAALQQASESMGRIRQQMLESAKRIKQLGESSQEIGEITELMANMTEQTQVLALNAAVQAAAAGEAGRGFAVIAEEVQRLAERGADATRQIAARVGSIRTDTQAAVSAVERSTLEVVEGTRRWDKTAAALTEIDRLSRQADELITQMSAAATHEAQLGEQTAEQIEQILAGTEQSGVGIRASVQQMRELARLAAELRLSVARFTLA